MYVRVVASHLGLCSSSFDAIKDFLSYLPTVNFNTLFYLVAFLRELLRHSDKNQLDAEKLGIYCFPFGSWHRFGSNCFVLLCFDADSRFTAECSIGILHGAVPFAESAVEFDHVQPSG